MNSLALQNMIIIFADYVMSIVVKSGEYLQLFKLITPESNFSAGCLTFDVISIPCRCEYYCEITGYMDVFTAVNQSSQRHILRENLIVYREKSEYEWHTIEGRLPAGVYRIVFEYFLYEADQDSMIWLANVRVSSNRCTKPGGQ